MTLTLRILAAALLVAALFAPPLHAEVASVRITERILIEGGRQFGDTGTYEQIKGKMTFAVDPENPLNQVIVGLDRVKLNGRGMVEATGDLLILRPTNPELGNGVALIDVANRGRLRALSFNRGGAGPYGDGFLMREGYTIVWVGWEFDAPSERPIHLDVPSLDGFPVGGLGFAAVRDAASWIKHEPEALVRSDHTLSFGSSQSGRFLRNFLYLGFNTDESGRQVFDGMMPHIAGAARIDLNRPGAEPVSLHMFATTSFPFADAALRDPVTDAVDGTLGNDRSRGNQPYIFYTNTGVEYWGGGRVAALVHTTPDGQNDLTPPDNVRVYFFAGTQHVPGGFPPTPGDHRQDMRNPTDYWWNMRALLTAMKDWVVDGVEPPPSRHPRFADGNLVRPAEVTFPAIPDVRSPRDRTAGTRIANTWLNDRGGEGTALPLLVPQVDTDGNETSGIRHPEVEVPLATYTGWKFTHPEEGDPDTLVALAGSYIPFPATRAQRERTDDPRLSIEERYDSREDFLGRIEAEARKLVGQRYLLDGDQPRILERAAQHWDLLMGGG